MYSQEVIDRNLSRIKRDAGIRLTRYSHGEIEDRKTSLSEVWDDKENLISRSLTREESEFIRGEILLSKYDFRHWCQNYATIFRDAASGQGGVGTAKLWRSQELFLDKFAEIEKEQHQMFLEDYPVDGIRVVGHKARQIGETMLARMITCHRLTLWKDQRAMAASVDDDKRRELYERDMLIFNNLPWYLRPLLPWRTGTAGTHEKADHINFDSLNTKILYQQANQMSGLGQGRQFEIGHLTECASWPYPRIIRLDFFPTLPQSIHTVCILESTAQGRGNWWHEFSEDVRLGNYREWHYIFIPWYTEVTKYRAKHPTNWNPSETTLLHARKVHETSPEFLHGEHVTLTKEQLYWYETSRYSALKTGELNIFLTNYCATPEESFQHTNESAFPFETLERLRLQSRMPMNTYEFVEHQPEKTERQTVN